MNSLTRLFLGLAWASCWPAAMQAARQGDPTLFLVAAVCALLPDALDRWVGPFSSRTDIHIVPDPTAPDPKPVADALALAIARCHDTRQRIGLCLYTPTGPAYNIRFDNITRMVSVSCGATGTGAALAAPATLDTPFRLKSGKVPLELEMLPVNGNRVAITLMPGGRWIHTLPASIAIGLLASLAYGIDAGLAGGGAYLFHVLLDQVGYGGSCWLAPFSRQGACGFQWVHPKRLPFLNLAVFWVALLVLGWNLTHGAFAAEPAPSLVQWLLFAGALPLAGLWLIPRIRRAKRLGC